MTEPDIRSRLLAALGSGGNGSSDFDLEVNPPPSNPHKLRPAAVLIPILAYDDAPRVILTKRASGLKHHPGQIAFPGGKVDPGDGSVEAAALREAQEEINLSPSAVEVLGRLPDHETVTCFAVTPIVGLIRDPGHLKAEPGEAEEIFSVPLLMSRAPTDLQSDRDIGVDNDAIIILFPMGHIISGGRRREYCVDWRKDWSNDSDCRRLDR